MRVLLAHKLFAVSGGAEVFFRETERILREHGHETMMLATGQPGPHDPENLTLLTAPAYDRGSVWQRASNLPAAIYDADKERATRRLLREFRPDVFHAFSVNVHLSPAVFEAAAVEDVPTVGTFNDYKHICPNYKLFHHGRPCSDCRGGRFYKAITNNCCKGSRLLSVASAAEAYAHRAMGVYEKVDHFTFSSDFMATTTQEFWPGRRLLWSKLRNPFASAAYQPISEYAGYGLYVGRLVEEKGVDQLLSAAADIGGFPLKIVGSGPDEQMLRRQVLELGLTNVEFLGPRWGDELDDILKRARFVVVPSVWHENFPYVINQAFAFARPVIGSRRGGITELVEDGARGITYEAGDIAALAMAIRELAESPRRAAELGINAKAYSDSIFRDDLFHAELMDIYARARDARFGARG